MPRQSTVSLKAVFSDILANLAFMFAEEPPEGGLADGPWWETRILYRGKWNGSLCLRSPRDFAVMLAGNMSSTDRADGKVVEEAKDAIKEFMNIVCGHFVTTFYGSEEVFDLSIPTVGESAARPEPARTGTAESVTLAVEGHVVELSHLPGINPTR